METFHSHASGFSDASPLPSEASMATSPCIPAPVPPPPSRPRFRPASIDTSAHTSTTPNRKPLSHPTSLKYLCRRRSMQTSAAPDMGNSSPNSAASFTNEKLSACGKSFPTGPIPHRSHQQLAFCKRRNRLFKRARELSGLCNAEVAAMVFSPSGRLSEFASSSMSHIIKRYWSVDPQMLSNDLQLQDVKRSKSEAMLVDARLKCLRDFERWVFEKNGALVSINDVQNIESMLEHSLEKIHKRKSELLNVEIQTITKEGEMLYKESILKEKLIRKLEMAKSARDDVHTQQDLYLNKDGANAKLQLWMDILQCTKEDEKPCSSNN